MSNASIRFGERTSPRAGCGTSIAQRLLFTSASKTEVHGDQRTVRLNRLRPRTSLLNNNNNKKKKKKKKKIMYEGPKMNPMGMTMSIIAFIKYVQGLHDVGYLIDLDKPIKDHVPTNAPHYAKHAVKANGLEKEESAKTARPIPSFGGTSRRTRSSRSAAREESEAGDSEEGMPEATHIDTATVSMLATIIAKDKKADRALSSIVDDFAESGGTAIAMIYKKAKVHPSSCSGIEKLQAIFAHYVTSADGKRRIKKEFDSLEQDDNSLKEFLIDFALWEELYVFAGEPMSDDDLFREFKDKLNVSSTMKLAGATSMEQVYDFQTAVEHAVHKSHARKQASAANRAEIKALKAKVAGLEQNRAGEGSQKRKTGGQDRKKREPIDERKMEMIKKQVCFEWAEHGTCKNGEKCKWKGSHVAANIDHASDRKPAAKAANAEDAASSDDEIDEYDETPFLSGKKAVIEKARGDDHIEEAMNAEDLEREERETQERKERLASGRVENPSIGSILKMLLVAVTQVIVGFGQTAVGHVGAAAGETGAKFRKAAPSLKAFMKWVLFIAFFIGGAIVLCSDGSGHSIVRHMKNELSQHGNMLPGAPGCGVGFGGAGGDGAHVCDDSYRPQRTKKRKAAGILGGAEAHAERIPRSSQRIRQNPTQKQTAARREARDSFSHARRHPVPHDGHTKGTTRRQSNVGLRRDDFRHGGEQRLHSQKVVLQDVPKAHEADTCGNSQRGAIRSRHWNRGRGTLRANFHWEGHQARPQERLPRA